MPLMILCINTIFNAGGLTTIALDESTIFILSTNGTSETNFSEIQHQRILENIKSKTIDFQSDWYEAFNNVSVSKRDYMRAMLDNGENLLMDPRIKVSTIHGAKGGEAHNVILYLNQTANTIKGAKKSQEKQDEEFRVWYVGITRTIENLFLIKSKNKQKEFKL